MRKNRYGWIVCIASTVVMFLSIGININGYTIYQTHLLKEYHFSNMQGSMIIMLRNLVSVVALCKIDWVYDKYNIRKTIAFSLTLLALSRMLLGATRNYFICCIAGAFSAIANAWAGTAGLAILLLRWFDKKSGVAIGICSAGSGLATVLFPPVIERIITERGLRSAFLADAGFEIVLTVVAVALIRNSPEEVGQTSCGGSERRKTEAEEREKQETGISLSKTTERKFYVAAFVLGGPGSAGWAYLTLLYTTLGYSTGFVAKMMSLMGIMLIVGKTINGVLSDRVGVWRVNFLTSGAFFVAMLLGCVTTNDCTALPMISIVLYGLGFSLPNVSLNLWARDIGGKNEEKLLKWGSVAYTVGALLSSPLVGATADMFGSYVPIFSVFTAEILICIAIVQRLYAQLGLKHIPQREKY